MKFLKLDKKICCEDVIKSIYNLNELDIKTYKKLSKKKEIRANELAKKLEKERSTIYRSLQRLIDSGLCNKNTKTIKRGGYYHTYNAVSKKEIKKNLEQCIEKWYKKIKKTLEELK